MLPYQVNYYGNPHSRTHAYGWESEAAMETARKVGRKKKSLSSVYKKISDVIASPSSRWPIWSAPITERSSSLVEPPSPTTWPLRYAQNLSQVTNRIQLRFKKNKQVLVSIAPFFSKSRTLFEINNAGTIYDSICGLVRSVRNLAKMLTIDFQSKCRCLIWRGGPFPTENQSSFMEHSTNRRIFYCWKAENTGGRMQMSSVR